MVILNHFLNKNSLLSNFPMTKIIRILSISVISFLISILSVWIVQAQPSLTIESKVSINSIGEIRVGMNLPEAAMATSSKLYVTYAGSDSCYYLQTEGKLQDVSFMVTKDDVKSKKQYITSDIIARIDINNPQVKTISGAKIGDSEAKIKSMYGDKIQVTAHKYNPKGHYLTYIPEDKEDKNYRLIFETDGKVVTSYRVGKLPEVSWIERCS